MGKPLSRPDCLRQNPRCLGKGDEDEAYIEDCYVPQRSIYDTMRINEQIDQGTKLCQPSRSTLGSGGEVRGEGSTLSSNGTIGADIGGVFVSRSSDNAGGVKKLDERVIFDALKLTSDPQIMSPPRRHQGSDKKDNPNRRSWKAFMPPSYPEFAERLEASSNEGAEKRSSGAGIPLSPLQPITSHLPLSTPTSSTPSLPPYTPSPLSSAPHTPPVSVSPSLTPTISPMPPLQQHPLSRQKQLHPLLQKQQKQPHAMPSPSKEQAPTQTPHGSGNTPQQSPAVSRQVDRKRQEHRRTTSSSKVGIRLIPEEPVELVKTSDSERDSPLLDQDQGDSTPLIPPKPVFCPPTKARTWPRSITTGKRTQIGLRHNLPVLPPLPPLLGEDHTDEESLYLLDPPSPFLKEEEGLVYGGLPLSPCLSQEGGDEGLLGWGAQSGELRQRTASELKFEEDERRILEELEEEEQQDECRNITEEEEEEEEVAWKTERDKAEEERAQREEREWEAVLKLENREIIDQSWHRETLESEGWDLTGSSGHWPLLTPPTGFGGPGAHSASPCPSSGAESDDLFLELERQCEEDEGEEGVEMSVDPEPLDPYNLPCLEEEEEERQEEGRTIWVDNEGTLPLDAVNSAEPDEPELEKTNKHSKHIEEIKNLMKAQDHEKEHGFIDEECDIDYTMEDKAEVEEEEMSCPTDSALGQQLESDSSGIHMSQPDRTVVSIITQTDREQEKPTQTETDLDSGASSEREEEDYEASSPSRRPLNPYAEEEEEEQDEGKLREEEELGTEWDVYDQSEPSLDSSEGVLMDQSQEPMQKEMDSECTPDVDIQTPGQEDPVPSDFNKPTVEITCDTEGTSNCIVPTDVTSGLDMTEQSPDLETTPEVTVSTPKSDSALHIHQPPSVPHSPSKSDSCGAGLDSKDSEAFVISDSFVYLAVSAPPQYPSDCPPSPVEDSVPPSPIPKPPCSQDPHEDDEEEGSFLSPDSFVYMAAPERPQPGPSDVGSACDDTQDLDSYSEGTQSGMDGVEFVLGSMTGDSDWESDGSALDFPPLMSTDQAWDQLEPGLLQNLFTQTEPSQAQTHGPLEDEPQTGASASPTDLQLEPEQSSKAENETTSLPCSDNESQSEVGFSDN
uniref:Uncharacterized protein n=1 Tax=Acanthochromis polyacanthus TaxID=80966 RepID=A0A3Q1GS91_9TELE